MKDLMARLEEGTPADRALLDTRFAILSDIKQSRKKLDDMEKSVKRAKDLKSLIRERPIFKDFVSFAGEMAALLNGKG